MKEGEAGKRHGVLDKLNKMGSFVRSTEAGQFG
jgi:hypothetical protein